MLLLRSLNHFFTKKYIFIGIIKLPVRQTAAVAPALGANGRVHHNIPVLSRQDLKEEKWCLLYTDTYK